MRQFSKLCLMMLYLIFFMVQLHLRYVSPGPVMIAAAVSQDEQSSEPEFHFNNELKQGNPVSEFVKYRVSLNKRYFPSEFEGVPAIIPLQHIAAEIELKFPISSCSGFLASHTAERTDRGPPSLAC